MIDETERLRQLGASRIARAELHGEISSTNDRARELARGGCAPWTVVRAVVQTGGRGRTGRQWVSPEGGLYLSVVLRPRLVEVGLLPLATGVAVREALATWGVDARLKWPNDVLLGERKIAGILAEAASGSAGLEWVALGIGVNVRRPGRAVEAVAASIEEAAGCVPPETDRVAAQVVRSLAGWYDRLEGHQGDFVVQAWTEGSVDWEGRVIEGVCGTQVVRGIGRGIDASGALLLEQPDGALRRFLSGDVRLVRESEEDAACS